MTQLITDLLDAALADRDEGRLHYLMQMASFEECSARSGVQIVDVLNGAAAWLARSFHEHRLSFSLADGLATSMQCAGMDSIYPNGGEIRDDIWWRVYLAFDGGEYSRGDSGDPVESVTRPAIKALIAEL